MPRNPHDEPEDPVVMFKAELKRFIIQASKKLWREKEGKETSKRKNNDNLSESDKAYR